MTPPLPSDQNIFFFSFGHRHGRGIIVYFIRFCLVVVAHSGEKSPNDVGPSEEVDLQPYHHKMFFYRGAAVQVKFFHHLRQADVIKTALIILCGCGLFVVLVTLRRDRQWDQGVHRDQHPL